MKLIKFDLPIDGVKVKNIEELRDHFTTEIVGHFRSDLLAKWLRSRGKSDEIAAVEALTAADNDAVVFKGLCQIFQVEVDDDAITAAFTETTGISGINPQQRRVQSLETLLKGLCKMLDRKIDDDIQTQINTTIATITPVLSSDAIDAILRQLWNILDLRRFSDVLAKSIFGGVCQLLQIKEIDDGIIDTVQKNLFPLLDSRYLNHRDGTVTDITTGLQWRRCAEGQTWNGTTCVGQEKTYNWSYSITDNNGWRLPTYHELITLIYCKNTNEYGKPCDSYPAINIKIFPMTQESRYWSSSVSTNDSKKRWYINFDRGTTDQDTPVYRSFSIRLVRGK